MIEILKKGEKLKIRVGSVWYIGLDYLKVDHPKDKRISCATIYLGLKKVKNWKSDIYLKVKIIVRKVLS